MTNVKTSTQQRQYSFLRAIKMWCGLLMLINPLSVFSQGIVFTSDNWKSVVVEAKRDGRLIFVDVFTTWCAPCRQMDKDVFSRTDVGAVYNKNFVNWKVDAEQQEGEIIQKRYDVNAYPTFLFLDPSGQLIYKHIGMATAEDMIRMAHQVQEERTAQSIADWENDFNKHQQDTVFLYQYLQKRNKLQLESAAIFDAYINLLLEDDVLTRKRLVLIADTRHPFPLDSRTFTLLMKQYDAIRNRDQQIKDAIDKVIERSMMNSFHTAYQKHNIAEFGLFLKWNEKMPVDYPFSLERVCYQEIYYRINKDWEQYRKVVIPAFGELMKDVHTERFYVKRNQYANTATSLAGVILEQFGNDNRLLKQTKEWVEAIMLLKPDAEPTQSLIQNMHEKLVNQSVPAGSDRR